MADHFNITVSGIDEVCNALKGELDAVEQKLLKKGLEASAVPIQEALYAKTPVSEHPPSTKSASGQLEIAVLQHLKDSITFNVQVSDKGGVMSMGFGDMGRIANWVEYGHDLVGHGEDTGEITTSGRHKGKTIYSHKDLGSVPPHPFMKPALESSAEAATEAFVEVFEDYYGS